MFGKKKPYIWKSYVYQIEQEVQHNETASAEVLRGVLNYPQTIHGNVKNGCAYEYDCYFSVVIVFNLEAHIYQHQRKSQHEDSCCHSISDSHKVSCSLLFPCVVYTTGSPKTAHPPFLLFLTVYRAVSASLNMSPIGFSLSEKATPALKDTFGSPSLGC